MVADTPNLQTALVADKHPSLVPERHPQHDLFICDVGDAVLKDVMPQLEHPFYSLSKKPETSVRRYEHNGNWLEVTPSIKGLATIYDKDILIYCISQIMAKRSEEHTSELQSLMRISYAVFCLKKKIKKAETPNNTKRK